ncbi:hypothetical protein LTR37_009091 [Vermiconidia calcicola]|uniref:Uncharacterized protein n=1 Tax=Vermiconidia calcicola TaxID=1690605 RepID=A0ACC3NAB1_9PEZI|nr:hypothetical protein LTR37_009091 [Vermiconidia calcicola]
MSSTNESSTNGWRFDIVSRQWVWYSQQDRCWGNQAGERVRSPQFDEPVAGPSATPTSQNVSQMRDLTTGVSRMGISSQRAQATTAKDPITGAATRWEVSASTPYTDPSSLSQRALHTKHIRESVSVIFQGYKPERPPQSLFRRGKVIEVLLVPPQDTSGSAISRMTPAGGSSDVRLRRFVIVKDNLPNGNTFEAIPIKTYNGRGVAAPGVIKTHHAIIYTGQEPPTPNANEEPRRMTHTGEMEEGMHPQAIKVITYDRTKALDPMARLDYADKYEFDHRVPNVRLFAKVDESSEAAMFGQFHLVWARIDAVMNASRNTSTANTTASSSTAVPASRSASQSTNSSTRVPAPRSVPQSGNAGTGVPAPRSVPQSANAGTGVPAQRLVPQNVNAAGPVTYQQVEAAIQRFQVQFDARGLESPTRRLNEQQIQTLVQDARRRGEYFQRLKDMLTEHDNESD